MYDVAVHLVYPKKSTFQNLIRFVSHYVWLAKFIQKQITRYGVANSNSFYKSKTLFYVIIVNCNTTNKTNLFIKIL